MSISMTEINMLLKENFARQLQTIKNLPEDLAKGYKNWIRGLVKEATKRVQAEAQPVQTNEE